MKKISYYSALILSGMVLMTACDSENTAEEKEVMNSANAPDEIEESFPDPISPEELINYKKLKAEDISASDDKSDVYRYSSDYNLSDIPKVVFEAVQIQTMELNSYNGTTLPEDLLKLKNLSVLYLSGAGNMETLPEFLTEMESLKTIAINNAKKLDLNQAFKVLSKCKKIEAIQITHGDVPSDLPNEIGQLKNLNILDLSHNNITSFHDSFFTLPNLKRLNISSLEGKRYDYELLFQKMKDLPALSKLSIYYSGIDKFPDVISTYPSLQTINWREDGKGWENTNAITKTKEKWGNKFEGVNFPLAPYESLFYDFY